MNKERAKHMAEILLAYSEGKEIEERPYRRNWRSFEKIWMLDDEDYEYRIKPCEFWVCWDSGRELPDNPYIETDPENLTAYRYHIKVREVLD